MTHFIYFLNFGTFGYPPQLSSIILYCLFKVIKPKWRKIISSKICSIFLVLLSLLSLQLSTIQASMEETTAAAALQPAEEIHQSCVSDVGRLVMERWCVSRTRTSIFTASPAKVKKNPYLLQYFWYVSSQT